MDFPFMCHTCHAANPQPYRDSNRYAWTCGCGAKNAATLRNERFEILFDFGALAFLDGYYRESVANFATAFERFLEFFVRSVLAHRGIARGHEDASWKHLAKQSERQQGAFVATYLLAFGSTPEMPAPRDVEFRNDVVHRGLIPERVRTVDYATKLYRLMKAHLTKLCALAPRSVTDRLEEPAQQHAKWAEAEQHKFVAYCFDGLFGVYRFLPDSLGIETEREGSFADKGLVDLYSTKLDFLDALNAREMFLRGRFVRPARQTAP